MGVDCLAWKWIIFEGAREAEIKCSDEAQITRLERKKMAADRATKEPWNS